MPDIPHMEGQLDMFEVPFLHTQGMAIDDYQLAKPAWADDDLGTRWWAFHVAHPEVLDRLSTLVDALLAKGYQHLGIAMLWETLRYETMLGAEVPREDVVRLNNSHRAFYARYLMETVPAFDGVFEIRQRRTIDG